MTFMNAVFAVLAALAGVDDTAAPEPNRAPYQELDEVTVHGSQVHLSNLRQAMVDAEDRFYSRYNELNSVDAFDVSCHEEARTGTRLRKRNCRALYEEQAIRTEGFEAFKIRQFLHEPGSIRIMPASPPVPAAVAIEARRPEFQRNMRNVVGRNEELVRLLMERATAIDRFEAARRSAFKSEDSSGSSSAAAPADVHQ